MRITTIRHWAILALLCVLTVGSSTAWAADQTPSESGKLTVSDVIEMVKVKLGDDLIIGQIRQNGAPFKLSSTEMIQLKSLGASDDVIRAMMDPKGQPHPEEIPVGATLPVSLPSESDGQRGLAARITAESEGRAKLASFSKTDGQSAQVNGVPIYSLEFEGTVEFTEECKWLREMFAGSKLEFKTRALKPKSPNELNNFFEASQFPGVVVTRGAMVGIAGTVAFEKSENGWRPSRVTGKITSDPSRNGQPSAGGADYAVTYTLAQGKYVGATTFKVDGNGVVTGHMSLTSPIAIEGMLNGEVKAGTWTFDFPYTMSAQGCSGTVKGTAKVSLDAKIVSGEATIGGTCVERPTPATFRFTRK